MNLLHPTTESERRHSKAIDNFIYNGIIKTGTGYALGLMISFAFFKRKIFPMVFGIGVGAGFAISDFSKELKSIE